MANNKLTLLACSGSILAATLFAIPSHGMPFANPSDGSQRDEITTPRSTQTEEIATPASLEKQLKQAAINRFGCGCTNCISDTRQLVRTGELTL
jgi:hypothetical protein